MLEFPKAAPKWVGLIGDPRMPEPTRKEPTLNEQTETQETAPTANADAAAANTAAESAQPTLEELLQKAEAAAEKEARPQGQAGIR